MPNFLLKCKIKKHKFFYNTFHLLTISYFKHKIKFFFNKIDQNKIYWKKTEKYIMYVLKFDKNHKYVTFL